MILKNKSIIIFGGTGSLGNALIKKILSGVCGRPKKVVIFSRDEAKQHMMRLRYYNLKAATEEIIYQDVDEIIEFIIGDVRDYSSVLKSLKNMDMAIYTAALKQVPACEYFPDEAIKTNINGAQNVIRAINENKLPVEVVIGVSTDKACMPVNVMGMTKAIQERLWVQANVDSEHTRFACVRYGNVLASRGSVIPLFHHQIKSGKPVTITSKKMTRFLMTLEQAVDLVFDAVRDALPGETYIPEAPSANITNIAKVLIGKKDIKIKEIGIRPGEKINEVLISEEEMRRSYKNENGRFVIMPFIPELLKGRKKQSTIKYQFSSKDKTISSSEIKKLLSGNNLLINQKQDDIDISMY